MPASLAFLMVILAVATPPERHVLEWHPDPVAGEAWRFALQIDRPEPKRDNGVAVMLLGGGLGTDLDWTVPGVVTPAGAGPIQLTIDGSTHRDGVALSEALTAGGFSVWRYSGFREDDALLDLEAGTASVMPFPDTLAVADAALDRFLEIDPREKRDVILLGHSLGATRAVLIAGDRAGGMVLLAGARLSPFGARPREASSRAFEPFASLDADGSGGVSEKELGERPLPASFESLDCDGDGQLRGWELAAPHRTADEPSLAGQEMFKGIAWASDVMATDPRPTLAVTGGLDTFSLHHAWLGHAASVGAIEQVEVTYFARFGHQLGEESADGARFGPIDGGVLESVVDWAKGYVRATR